MLWTLIFYAMGSQPIVSIVRMATRGTIKLFLQKYIVLHNSLWYLQFVVLLYEYNVMRFQFDFSNFQTYKGTFF